jgi:predicted CoA-binding protein
MNVVRIPAPNVPEPGVAEGPSLQDLLRIYDRTMTIAIVGGSADARKAANSVPSYLQSQGYYIIPVFEGCLYPG